MAQEFEFSLIAEFKDKASRGVKKLSGRLEDLNDYARGRRGGILGGLFGGFASRRGLGTGPGGIGGIVSDTIKGLERLAMAPVRGLTKLTKLIPKVGGLANTMGQTAINAFQGITDIVSNLVGGALNTFLSMLRRASKLLGSIIGKLTTWGGLAFAGATAFSVRQAGKVQDAWNRVRTILKLGPKEAKEMMMTLRDEAIRTGKSAQEVIRGYYQVLSAGFQDPKKALQVLRTSLEASVGGWTQMPTVVKLASRTMRAFQRPVSEVRSVMDSLMQTVHVGQIEMPELASLFGRLGNSAAESNFSLNETLSMLGVIARADKPEEVVTQLQAAFMKLNNQTGQARKSLKKLAERGLDIRPQAIKDIGLQNWLDRLAEAKRRFPRLMSDIFPERAAKGVNNLIKFMGDIEGALGDLQNSAGTTKDDFTTMMDSVTKAAEQAWRVVKDLATAYGKPTARWLTDVRDRIAESGWSMDWLRKKAREAGKTVRDAFKGVYDYLKGISEGRDLDWEGIKGALSEVKKDAIAKAREAWAGIKSTLWPKITQGVSTLLDELWAMIGEKVAGLPRLIGSQLRETAARRMKSIVKAREEEMSKPALEKLWYSIKHPISGAWQGLQDLTGAMDPETRAQFMMWQSMAKAGSMMTGAGSAMGQSARNAQRRKRRRDWRQAVGRRGRWIARRAVAATAGGQEPTAAAKQQLASEINHLVQQRGGDKGDMRKAVDELIGLLRDITADQRQTDSEVQKLRREIKRIATARY